jgi:hypothetical protein
VPAVIALSTSVPAALVLLTLNNAPATAALLFDIVTNPLVGLWPVEVLVMLSKEPLVVLLDAKFKAF